jgi:hypothetical protein
MPDYSEARRMEPRIPLSNVDGQLISKVNLLHVLNQAVLIS